MLKYGLLLLLRLIINGVLMSMKLVIFLIVASSASVLLGKFDGLRFYFVSYKGSVLPELKAINENRELISLFLFYY